MVYRSLDKINTIIVHCAATQNGRPLSAKQIDDMHGPGRAAAGKIPFNRRTVYAAEFQSHLKHIGYHYVIGTDGSLECGRGLTEVGSHAYRHNTYSIGICLIGTDQFSSAQWLTLKSLVQTLQTTLSIEKVIGHNDLTSLKRCPCFDVKQWLENDFTPETENVLIRNYEG